MAFDLKERRVWIAGHNGMVGKAVFRRLKKENCQIITATRDELDLTRQDAVHNWLQENTPDAIILAAARVGGILVNSKFPVEFLYENLMIQTNIIHAAHQANVERLLFLGSSCIYPKLAKQPIKETSLMTGQLDASNQWYATAKIAGLMLVRAYRLQYDRDWISAMPTNLYGPGDNYNLENSHVVPALLRKVHEAKVQGDKEVVIWGTGSPLREFMHCDDLADALVFILKGYSDDSHVNIGSGTEISIRNLVETISEVVGYSGQLTWDTSKPDGAPRRLLDISRLAEKGWNCSRNLREGIKDTYLNWCKEMGY